ncbi:hypothetical protein SAMN05421688_2987 [Poseidonocella pacifica]|uniref:Ferrochelatase n=1 Tax=Poseidonocella pacifica TaxID=871651 RepID=A0A1I0YDW7_9RHOB|nr:hypothetical protein [Poseidonocella pacifica]SFB11555.1 hypothetical protein SAMN05421688_2987 [Poseidonocella pacifica]
MKKLALAAALSVAGTHAFAGSMAEPVMEAPVIVEETEASSSGAGLIVPLILIALVAAAVSAD